MYTTAIDRLETALSGLHILSRDPDFIDRESGRKIAIAITHTETALLWLKSVIANNHG